MTGFVIVVIIPVKQLCAGDKHKLHDHQFLRAICDAFPTNGLLGQQKLLEKGKKHNFQHISANIRSRGRLLLFFQHGNDFIATAQKLKSGTKLFCFGLFSVNSVVTWLWRNLYNHFDGHDALNLVFFQNY